MNRIARRGLAAAAIGTVALGLTACGGLKDAASGSGNDTPSDPKETTEEVAVYDCDDLGDQVWTLIPDENVGLFDAEADQFNKLTQWMYDNGALFTDPEVGSAVTTWGELGGLYYNFYNADEEMSDKDLADFDAADKVLEASCDGLGFGTEEE